MVDLFTQQQIRYLAILEGMGSNMPPAVHYMLHHFTVMSTHTHCTPWFFLEEVYEAAHHQDKWFAQTTLHGCIAGHDHYNSWEMLLHNRAAWVHLEASGMVAWYTHAQT